MPYYRYNSGHHGILSAALLFTFAAAVLLWLCAFGAPYINSIYYVRDSPVGNRLGTFGWCSATSSACTDSHVGWKYNHVPGGKGLTGSLILTPIAAGLASLAVFTLMHSIYTITSVFGSLLLVTISAFIAVIQYILMLATFVTTHHRYDDYHSHPHYGPAFWMNLAATILILLAIPLAAIGWRTRSHGTRVTGNTYRA